MCFVPFQLAIDKITDSDDNLGHFKNVYYVLYLKGINKKQKNITYEGLDFQEKKKASENGLERY